MAKQKYTITENIEFFGTIDKQDDDYMMYVDGEEVSLADILDKCLGYEVVIKCTKIMLDI